MLDNVGGLNGGLAALPDGWVVSTNLAARVVDARRTSVRCGSTRGAAPRSQQCRRPTCRSATKGDARQCSSRAASSRRAILVPENGPPQWTRPLVLDTAVGVTAPGPAADHRWLGVRPAGDRRSRDRPRRRAAQSVGHPARWCRRDAGRPRGRTRDRRRLHHRCRAALPRAEPRRSGARDGPRRSARAADGNVLRVEVRDIGAGARPHSAIVTCTT